jgi:simple sugar transport system substrate-binding protein
MQLLAAEKRIESFDNGDVAYNGAKELFKKYPNLKGIMGTSSYDAPGVARAIEELGLIGKAFTSGTGMPLDNAALLESGVVKSLTLWDPALAGKAMIALAVQVLDGKKIEGVVDLGVDGYTNMKFKPGSKTVLEGEGWIVINAKNVYDFGF